MAYRGTESALYKFQKAKKKTADKKAGEATFTILFAADNNPSPNGEGLFLLYHTFVVYPYRSCSPIISFN